MENASKALLIAASVLIVILLIAFGVRIFNSTGDVGDQVDGTMKTTEVTMFNNKFNAYIGQKKSVNDIKSLANVIIGHNATAKSDTQKVYLYIYVSSPYAYCYTTSANTISATVSKLTGSNYKVTAYYNSNGYIYRLDVKV